MHYFKVYVSTYNPVLNQNPAWFTCITFSSSVAKEALLHEAFFSFSFFSFLHKRIHFVLKIVNIYIQGYSPLQKEQKRPQKQVKYWTKYKQPWKRWCYPRVILYIYVYMNRYRYMYISYSINTSGTEKNSIVTAFTFLYSLPRCSRPKASAQLLISQHWPQQTAQVQPQFITQGRDVRRSPLHAVPFPPSQH